MRLRSLRPAPRRGWRRASPASPRTRRHHGPRGRVRDGEPDQLAPGHERIESRRGEAYDAGWLLRHNGIEAGDPEETSLLYQARGWAWLTHDGRIIRAREDSQ